MYKCSAFAVWRELAGGSIFEAFNNGLNILACDLHSLPSTTYSFAGAIISNNKGQGGGKFDAFRVLVVEGPDAIGVLLASADIVLKKGSRRNDKVPKRRNTRKCVK